MSFLSTAGNVAKSVGLSVLSKLLSGKVWSLTNLRTNEVIVGQFPAEDVTESVGANWTQIQALNRQTAFLQFLNGKTPTLDVTSQFFKRDVFDPSPIDRIEKLKEWVKVDQNLRRPPLLSFSLGDGIGLQKDVILTEINDIKYSIPNGLGGIRRVSFTMKFLQADRSLLIQMDTGLADPEVVNTRYATSKEGQYYEQMALEEYGDPMLGVVIRQRHPDKPLLKLGDRVALSAVEGVRSELPAAISIPLKGAYGRKETTAKRRRIDAFINRSKSKDVTNHTGPIPVIVVTNNSGIFDYTFDHTFE